MSSNTYNFENAKDCKAFIGLLLDDFFPKQIENIDVYVITDAIKSCKENKIELTGTNLFRECCRAATQNFVCRLDEIKMYEWEGFKENLTPEEKICIEQLLSDIEKFSLDGEMFECNCNGSSDSSIWFNRNAISQEESVAIRKLNELTNCFSDFKLEIGSITGLDEILYNCSKKDNMALWDELESSVEDAIKFLASAATSKYEDLDELIDRAYEDGVIPEVRDRIVEFLESIGLTIPYVEGNY